MVRNHHRDEESCGAVIFDDRVAADRDRLERLRATPGVDFIGAARPGEKPDVADDGAPTSEGKRWAYYAWRNAVVHVAGPQTFRADRLDRNRHLITAAEQRQLQRLKIGVVGLSSGHAVAYCLAAEGLCGGLRLADGDTLDLSNLNRVPATVFDLGVNKATVAARRIAELDPYLDVDVIPEGVAPDTVDSFLDGLDVVVDQADSLDIKILLREAARERGIPVIMATSDRGLLDVERFDLEPRRPIMHGLLGDIDTAVLRGLSTKEKLPYLLRLLDAGQLSSRGAASLVEVGQTLGGWPQLASDIWVGAATVAEAVRRIGLGHPLGSGRVQVDLADALDQLRQPGVTAVDLGALAIDDEPDQIEATDGVADAVAAAAIRAPSGGNCQPWRIVTDRHSIRILLSPDDSVTMDVGFRASTVALGAAMFNVRVAAAAHGVLGTVDFAEGQSDSPFGGIMHWGRGDDPGLAKLYRPMLARATNRHRGNPTAIQPDAAAALRAATAGEGAQLQLITDRGEIAAVADILAAADRIRFLSPRLHTEMISELRWPADPFPETGIDVRSLELDAGDFAALELLRRSDVMVELSDLDAGGALGDPTRERVNCSSALAVVTVDGPALADYARGGAAVEALWIAAEEAGFGVQPVSPVFLYAHGDEDMRLLAPTHADQLGELQRSFRSVARIPDGHHEALLLRLIHAPAPSVPARRRRFSAIVRVGDDR